MGDVFAGWKFMGFRYSHKNTLSLGNYRGHPFVTGCDGDIWCSKRTEIMKRQMTDGEYWHEWHDAPDYPFAPDSR